MSVSWSKYKLEDISLIIAGQSPNSDSYNFNKNGLPFFQGKADFGSVSPTPKVWCSNPIKIAEKDDILLSVRAPVGPTNIADEKCCIGRGLSAIRVNNNVNMKFVYLFLKLFEKNISQMGSGSTFSAITNEDVRKIEIFLPPLEEQERIVKIIENKLTAVENAKKASDEQEILIEKLLSSIIQNIIYNKEWVKNKLGNICEFAYGDSLPKQNRVKGNVPVYGSNGQIDLHDKSLIEGKTIIVGRKGSIGEVHYSEIDCWVIDTAYYVKPLLEVDIKYLYLLLKTLNLSKLNKASSIPGLNRDDVYKIDVPLPPLEQQQQIVNIIEAKLKAVEKTKNKITEQSSYINTLPSSILRKAFNGDY